MADMQQVLKTVGSGIGYGLARAGAFVAEKAVEGYRAIDPDVMRHAAHLPIMSYSLAIPRHETVTPRKPDGYPPLIFVHGLGGNRGTFLPMSSYLWLLGRRRSYKIGFESGSSLKEMATDLVEFIESVKESTGEPKVDLVGHSMGGLVARLAIETPALAGSIDTLITLGTPHGGTCIARYANTETIRLLRQDSPLLNELARRPWPKDVRGVTCFSRNDLIILPPESAAVEGTMILDLSPATHYSYLFDINCLTTLGQLLVHGVERRAIPETV
jgi:pimeloyl-ACP methyl ester carboxylesterase